MKKISLMIAVSLALVMTFIAGDALAQKKPAKGKLPPMIGIATAGVGSGGHSMAVSFAPVMQKYFGVPIRVMPAWSVAVNLSQIKDRKAHVVGGGASQGNAGMAAEGSDYWADHSWGPQEVGIVWYNYTCPYGILVRGDSKIKTISDLRGKKCAIYLVSPAWTAGLEGCLAFGGMTMKDIQTVEVGDNANTARAVVDGRADFSYNTPIGTISIEVEQNPKGIRYIPMDLNDKAGWARYFKINPFFSNLVCTTGVKSGHGIPMANHPFVVWTYKWVDSDLIYRMAKFFSEQHDQYKMGHAQLLDMSFENMLKFKDNGIALPILPGTIKYLKEKGKWDAADEKWNNEQWGKFKKLTQAWDAATEEAISKKINPTYKNKAWLEIWDKHRATVPRFSGRIKQ